MKRSPLVLIVDDATDNREGYAQYLQFCGFRTAEAETGQDALIEADRSRPDVILLDMRLPGLDGVKVTRRLPVEWVRDDSDHRAVRERDRIRHRGALDSGCDAFLASRASRRRSSTRSTVN